MPEQQTGTVENKWNHPHMSFSGLMLSMLMRFIQGKDDIYYCGSYATPANGHDLSLTDSPVTGTTKLREANCSNVASKCAGS